MPMKLTVFHFLYIFGTTCVILLYVSYTKESENDRFYQGYHRKDLINKNSLNAKNFEELLFDYCKLPHLDPWDSIILKYLDPNKNPNNNCKPSYKKLTTIVNNTVVMLPETKMLNCSYRCLIPKSGDQMTMTNWTVLLNNTKPACDIVQVACDNAVDNSTYRFVHKLIYRNESQLPPKQPGHLPNVHIIVIDSVSKSHFERSMLRTKTFLRSNLQSQPMNYLNKVGGNSRPNAIAFLFGKSTLTIEKSPFSVGYKGDYVNDSCHEPLDNDQFIAHRYRDAGYVTMMAEDWLHTVFCDPRCPGFTTPPAQHYFKPYQLFTDANHEYRQNVFRGQCREPVHQLLDYQQKFMDTFPDRPIFSLTWFTKVAHDDTNEIYHADDYFYRFLQKNELHLQNSYLFFMGDHGMRFGAIRKTEIGEAEDKNPFLYISVPKDQRSNEIMDQLRINSDKLISHYDIYATLVGLVNPTKATIPKPLIHGENLLKSLKEPRTCDRLRIPFEYCMCNFQKTKMTRNTLLLVRMATACVKRMNEELNANNDTGYLCSKLTLNVQAGVEGYRYREDGDQTVYHISWKTMPGDGAFESHILYDSSTEKFNIVSIVFPRSNVYRDQAKCVNKNPWESYCYCKDLLKDKKV